MVRAITSDAADSPMPISWRRFSSSTFAGSPPKEAAGSAAFSASPAIRIRQSRQSQTPSSRTLGRVSCHDMVSTRKAKK